MAEPKVRFKQDDGSSYPAWTIVPFSKLSVPSGVKNKNDADLESYSISNEKGFVPQNEQFEDAGYLNNADRSLYYIVSPGSFAYNPARINIGSIGYQNVGKNVLVSSLYEIFNTTDELDDGFLMNWFKTEQFQKHVRRLSEGGVRQYFYYDKLCMVKFSLPCIEEQQKIADFLSSVDEVISTSEQEVANLETQKKAVMKKIFSQEVRFKRADGGDFPEWEERDFKEEADYLSGLTYSPDDVVPDADDGVLVLRSSNIQGGVIDYQDNVFVNCKISDSLYVQENDILMCVRNGSKKLVGKTALIKKADLGHTWGAFMMIIRSHTDNRFIYHYLNSDVFYKQMFPDVNTATIAQITKGMLNDCVVDMPCLEEQRFIADFFSDFDEAIAAAKKELELWKELKKGLLQQMFV